MRKQVTKVNQRGMTNRHATLSTRFPQWLTFQLPLPSRVLVGHGLVWFR